MKHFQLNAISVLILLPVIIFPSPLSAADPVTVQWNQVCRVAGGHELLVTTSAGEAIEGFCVQIDVNNLTVSTTDHRVVKVARNTLSKLEMHRANGHQLRSLRDGMRGGLRWGFDSLLSPSMPAAVVAIPATLAWGAVSAPFCLLGDLKAKLKGMQEIKPN
jgi:hypothetical protein